MNIVVCIKQVPATEAKIKVNPAGKDIERDELTYVINPYDEFGIEEGLRIKERIGEAEVIVLSMGSDRVVNALRTSLAMGADRAIHIRDNEGVDFCDSYKTALILSRVLKDIKYDIIFSGKQAIDDDNGAVGIQVAELLGLPHVSVVNRLEVDPQERKIVAYRQIEGGTEVIETSMPVVITCQKGMNEPRYPSLPGIMRAKQRPLQEIGLGELGIDMQEDGFKLRLIDIYDPPKRGSTRMIQGSPQEAVKELIDLLKEEAKVI